MGMKAIATMMDAGVGEGRQGEGRYEFDAPDDLFDRSPVKVIRAFMEHVDKVEMPNEDVDYELYSCLKNKHLKVVTGLGSLLINGAELPFMVMIAPKRGDV